MATRQDLGAFRGKRVIAAMSGGVDSSVMAALLAEAGADVIGVFLHVWDYSRRESANSSACCAMEDAYDARRVADHLSIPFYSMDMREQFRRDVIDPFVSDYESGRTPNPCERCNRFVKFGSLLSCANQMGAAFVATGHYVQRLDDASGVRLYRGADLAKDQSYFLATITRAQASRTLFPVGGLQKNETRELARRFRLPTASKHESQDICFVPAGDRVEFLRREGAVAGFAPGEIVDTQGLVLGRHDGIARYTLGQRKGLGLAGGPWNVVGLDGNAARVIVAPPLQAFITGVSIEELSWLRRPENGAKIQIKVRYRSEAASCCLTFVKGGVCVAFDDPQPLTAPGQVAAFYAGEELLGGGIISEVIRQQ